MRKLITILIISAIIVTGGRYVDLGENSVTICEDDFPGSWG